jgi:epimerase transport system membrane fusion protein
MNRDSKLPRVAPEHRPATLQDSASATATFNPFPATQVRALTFWLLLVGFGFFGVMAFLAATAKIQSAVVAPGNFEVVGDLQVVDHLEGGIIREIRSAEGQVVQKGEVLAILDGTRVNSQIGILRSQLAAALARQARLDAEAANAETIVFPSELDGLIQWDGTLAKVKQTQSDLFLTGRRADLGEMQIYSERIQQLNIRKDGFDSELTALEDQHNMVAEEVVDLTKLFKQDLVPKSRLYARREDLMQVRLNISQRESMRHDVFEQIAEVEERRLQVMRERKKSISAEQQVLTEDIFNLRQRLKTFDEIRSRLEIRAPISGRIVRFDTNTIGSVVSAGQTLMEIVPTNAPYFIEARVATSDIDEVSVGRPARIRLTAYSYRKTPPILGEVTHVSADSFFDNSANISYYNIHVQIDSETLARLPNVQPQPGMPVQVMVATGEQTVLTYLLDPILGGIETAMIESE